MQKKKIIKTTDEPLEEMVSSAFTFYILVQLMQHKALG